jgi:hypothetical protein
MPVPQVLVLLAKTIVQIRMDCEHISNCVVAFWWTIVLWTHNNVLQYIGYPQPLNHNKHVEHNWLIINNQISRLFSCVLSIRKGANSELLRIIGFCVDSIVINGLYFARAIQKCTVTSIKISIITNPWCSKLGQLISTWTLNEIIDLAIMA